MVPTTQIPGVYHRRIGDIVVTALSDTYLMLPEPWDQAFGG